MNGTWRHLPAPARAIAVAATDAVAAAQARDEEGFAEAVASLAALEPAQTGLVLGATVRLLLEDEHPDGLDGDDIRDILDRCVVSAKQWQPAVDQLVLLVLLAGALGIQDDDTESPPPTPEALARHAALLLAELLSEKRPDDSAHHSLEAYLTKAFAEIQRAETQD
jgi:hypothetical protein